ncbi:MAG: polysaccharide biosynthesis protein [Thermoleophilia bacterium]
MIVNRPSLRRLLAMSVDMVMVAACYYLALTFRFAGQIPAEYRFYGRNFLIFGALAVIIHLAANRLWAVYTIVNRYVGLSQALNIAQASVMATAALMVISAAWLGDRRLVPLSVVLAGGILTAGGMVGVRFYGRVFYERSLSNVGQGRRRLLLVGAGQAADMILREVHRNRALQVRVVGLVDDDPRMRGMCLQGFPVLGTVEETPEIVRRHDVDEILIVIPSANGEEMSRIFELCRPAGVPIKTLPGLVDLVDGTASLADARALDIQDLLGRPKVETDLGAIAAYLRGKRVLVTGAGGSIGSELSRQIAAFEPQELVLLDRDESALYALHEDLRVTGFTRYRILPANVGRRAKMDKVFALHRPQVVFHAAAFKHVPLMEMHPDEAVLNNVNGTLQMAETAACFGTERFVNISTDKAVDPVNVMGATKRIGEQVLRMLSTRHPDTRFCSVRFGNVLGSRGSVIPIFQNQIANGGPVTVTHPDMTRYFMMIEEAVQLVLQAASMVEEIPRSDLDGHYGAFVLEMGSPIRIVDLAQRMIELLGNGHAPDVAIEFTGLRPGEKLHETLLCDGEYDAPTTHPLVHLACLTPTAGCDNDGGAGNVSGLPPEFERHLRDLIALAATHPEPGPILTALAACVPTYRPFDWSQVGTFPGVTPATT